MTRFDALVGKTLDLVIGCEIGSDQIELWTTCGKQFQLKHYQDCCEQVSIEDIDGEVDDIVGSCIIVAEEVNSVMDPDVEKVMTAEAILKGSHYDSCTWTFYKIDTAKGGITIRWFGTSNGYYSESVSFEEINNA